MTTSFAPSPYLNIEAHVRILEGPDAPEQNLRLFRVMQNRATGPLSWFGGEPSEEGNGPGPGTSVLMRDHAERPPSQLC